jgi:hypothetical protein
MKIRFKIDLTDLFRRRIDAETSIVALDIDPSTLPEDQHELIGKHLLNNNDGGCNVVHDPQRAQQLEGEVVPIGERPGADLVEAKNPTLESLLEALTELEAQTNLNDRTRAFAA